VAGIGEDPGDVAFGRCSPVGRKQQAEGSGGIAGVERGLRGGGHGDRLTGSGSVLVWSAISVMLREAVRAAVWPMPASSNTAKRKRVARSSMK
jgi:hypothetical protein